MINLPISPWGLGLIILGTSFLEVVFPPAPGDAVLVYAGYLTGRAGVSPVIPIFFGIAGTLTGTLLLYYLGLRFGPKLLHSKVGEALLAKNKWEQTEAWVRRYGPVGLLISRFIPGIRSGLAFFAGVAEMPWHLAFLTLAGSISLFVGLLFFGGRSVGKQWREFLRLWNEIGLIMLFAVVACVICYFTYRRFRRWRQAKKNNL